MSPERFRLVADLFLKVGRLGIHDRDVFLDDACRGDEELRREVLRLVDATEDPIPFAELAESLRAAHDQLQLQPRPSSSEGTSPTRTFAASESNGGGGRIGVYKLLQRIGEGGFGVVYLAEQEQPVRRRVALKVIKLGMDTRQVVARFEQERQALAMMDHPNIARVFDGGATESGRPYFVMELVRGLPITQFCDGQSLAVHQRLELFQDVCHAVQHAHTKGVIHRDLKPSNVLVTLHDDKAVVKVIDFGVAKATQQPLTDKTLFTDFHQLIGTPAYMSPEQAQFHGQDVDTRSDVYSLGVLLYELLAGVTPFDADGLRRRGQEEMLRVIREEDPPRPSTRIRSTPTPRPGWREGPTNATGPDSADHPQTAANIARLRHTDPLALARTLHGDLDWIVMKCLEKDRTRRYETANGLAMDLRRHLAGEPVAAAPPSKLYKLRKFARRHRVGVVAGVATFTAVFIGIIGTTIGMVRARTAERMQAEQLDIAVAARTEEARQRHLAEEEEANARAATEFLQSMFHSVDPAIRAILTEAPEEALGLGGTRQLEFRFRSPGALPNEITVLELLRRAIPKIEESTRGRPSMEATIRETIGGALLALGVTDATPQLGKAAALYNQVHGLEHPRTLRATVEFAEGLLISKLLGGENDPGGGSVAATLVPIVPLLDRILGPDDPDTLRARLYLVLGDTPWAWLPATAVDPLRSIVEDCVRALGTDHEITLRARCHLANAMIAAGERAEAEQLVRQTMQMAIDARGRDDDATLAVRFWMVGVLDRLGRKDEAVSVCREAVIENSRVLGVLHSTTETAVQWLRGLLRGDARIAERLAFDEDRLAALVAAAGPDNMAVISFRGVTATDAALTGDTERACELLEQMIKGYSLHRDQQFAGLSRRLFTLSYSRIFRIGMTPVAQCLIEPVERLLKDTRSELQPGDLRRYDVAELMCAVYAAAGRWNESIQVIVDEFEESRNHNGLSGDEGVYAPFFVYLKLLDIHGATDQDVARVSAVVREARHRLASDPAGLARYLSDSALLLSRSCDDFDSLLNWAREGVRLNTEAYGADTFAATRSMDTLAIALFRAGQFEEAIALESQVVDRLGSNPRWTPQWQHSPSPTRSRGLMFAAAGLPGKAKHALLGGCQDWEQSLGRDGETRWVHIDPYFALWTAEELETLSRVLGQLGDAEGERRYRLLGRQCLQKANGFRN